MNTRDLALHVAKTPLRWLSANLENPPDRHYLIQRVVVPGSAIRALAALASSMIMGSLITGVVLGISSFVLLVSAWRIMSTFVPTIAKQFEVEISEERAAYLIACTSLPLWYAGVLLTIPETTTVLFYISRVLVLLISLYGIYILRSGLEILKVQNQRRMPLLAALSGSYFGIYAGLYTVLGLVSYLILFIVKSF